MEREPGGRVFDNLWTIEMIPQNRGSDRIKMYTDLMEPTGDRAGFDECRQSGFVEDAERGERGFARVVDPAPAGRGVPRHPLDNIGHRFADHTLVVAWCFVGQCPVVFLDLPLLELFAEPVVRKSVQSDDEEPGGFLVEPMEHAMIADIAQIGQLLGVLAHEPVEQGVVLVPDAWGRDHPGWFFDDKEVLVLEMDLEGDPFVGFDLGGLDGHVGFRDSAMVETACIIACPYSVCD